MKTLPLSITFSLAIRRRSVRLVPVPPMTRRPVPRPWSTILQSRGEVILVTPRHLPYFQPHPSPSVSIPVLSLTEPQLLILLRGLFFSSFHPITNLLFEGKRSRENHRRQEPSSGRTQRTLSQSHRFGPYSSPVFGGKGGSRSSVWLGDTEQTYYVMKIKLTSLIGVEMELQDGVSEFWTPCLPVLSTIPP